ncbi:hypothetical protein EHR01_03995 [Leptospira mtsangambouensis]|uniref:GNAT family N-acetyltransferase n=1 Tax=Leptospira mtsangambouensis TaxID=2484912 RepID=A0ABY2P3P5_9LEPT|nr:hypothetical protein [Leptospira mtsangambouensis]TGM81958.1 hypothetical protein EHR01_03995 [Leptospira mtsangambouensis]
MHSVKIHSANKKEDEELVSFSSQFPSEGGFKLALDRSPSYFESLLKEGFNPDIIIGRDSHSGKIVGIGHRTELNYILNGTKQRLGILSGLRLLKEFRSGIALAKGYKKLKELHNQKTCRGYLTTIQSENKNALKILTSARAGLPNYHFIDHLTTFIWNPTVSKEMKNLQIQIFSNSIVETYLNQSHRNHSFLSLVVPNFIEKQLNVRKFSIYTNHELIAVFSLWDQSAWKRWKILKYNDYWKVLRFFYNCWAKIRRLPSLPEVRAELSYVFLTQLKIKQSQTKYLNSILNKILEKTKEEFPNTYLCYTLAKNDPWYDTTNQIPAWKIQSHGYLVNWEAKSPISNSLQKGFSEWEAGLL